MPSVRVRLFADIREEVGESEIEVEMKSEGETVGDVIEDLVARYPALEERLLSDGELRPYLNLTADGEPVGAGETVDGVDEVAVFPPVSGGS